MISHGTHKMNTNLIQYPSNRDRKYNRHTALPADSVSGNIPSPNRWIRFSKERNGVMLAPGE